MIEQPATILQSLIDGKQIKSVTLNLPIRRDRCFRDGYMRINRKVVCGYIVRAYAYGWIQDALIVTDMPEIELQNILDDLFVTERNLFFTP
ncbi:hypothetical protein ACFQ3K_03300 [Brucella gallinifaecis]|uniref:Uncharacterized protein n=1 Tax=Brucella gallinifaecis TaxID=215590 RepID=A0A502BQ95_9HYPH|nr:hypothetical protein [Brucella gallinifaecis]TPF75213.1 hypothetical protein FHY56_10880 [Brucella gallinifaecis]